MGKDYKVAYMRSTLKDLRAAIEGLQELLDELSQITERMVGERAADRAELEALERIYHRP